MSADLALVVGLVVAALSIPSIISALTNGRSPRVATIVIFLGLVLVVYAVSQKPGGYSFSELPDVFTRVMRQLLQ